MNALSSVRRACGRRMRGGIYAETRLSEDGHPIEAFIVDPPIPVDIGLLGLAAVGVQLIEVESPAITMHGIHHVFDVVGQEYYPYPADYIEETRRLGASRRLPANLNGRSLPAFSQLGPGSRLVLIHARAVIENFVDYPQPPRVQCPKGIDTHAISPLPEMCAGLWWHDLPDQPDESGRSAAVVAHHALTVLRRIEGGTRYLGYPRPVEIVPSYQHGIFLSLPISNLAVIQGGDGKDMPMATERNHQAACVSGLPVYLEEE
jgi:hypothetical protein